MSNEYDDDHELGDDCSHGDEESEDRHQGEVGDDNEDGGCDYEVVV